jgi:protein-L-isoaspartate(D-aspartate) O-methyltransferase
MELNVRNVHFHWGDGTIGWPGVETGEVEPFDRILIAAGAPSIPRELFMRQLRDGGIAVLPVGPQNEQMLVAVTRRGDKLESEEITPVRFVRLIGKEGWPDEQRE